MNLVEKLLSVDKKLLTEEITQEYEKTDWGWNDHYQKNP